MAYGKPGKKPRIEMKRLGQAGTSGKHQAETEKTQDGKTGTEGADPHALADFGGMPSSGEVKANAGSVDSNIHGGSTKGAGKVKKTPGNPKSHEIENQAAGKKPEHPGSHGGPHTGSVDTLTHLIFHPKGGMANKAPAKRVSPKHDGKYKDSGSKTAPQIAHNDVHITRGRA